MKRIISITMLLVLLLTGCGKEDIPELISPARSLKSYFSVTRGNIANEKVSDGYITPLTETVYFEMDGIASDITYRVGDQVNEGDVIFSLYENIDEDLAALELQLSNYKTISDYYVTQHANEIKQMKNNLAGKSGSDYELYELQIEALQIEYDYFDLQRAAEYEVLSAQYAELSANKDKAAIVAPCTGTIAYIGVKSEGEGCTEGNVACIITDNSEKMVQFSYETAEFLESLDSFYIKIGNEIYEDVSFLEYTETELNYFELYGYTVYSRALIEDLPDDIDFGTYCAVYQCWDTAEDVLYVPTESIYTDATTLTNYCVLLNEEGKEEKVTITAGTETSAYTEVVEGLSEGQLVYHTDDVTSWGTDNKTTEAYMGDYSHYLEFDNAYKSSSDFTDIPVILGGKISEIHLEKLSDIYIEADSPILTYTAEVEQSVYEQAKLDYNTALNSYDSSISDYDAQITSKQEMLDNAANDMEEILAQSELTELENGRADFVEALDQNLAILEEKYTVYEAAYNGESITISAPASGILNLNSNLFVGGEIFSDSSIGMICEPNSYLCYSSDYVEMTGESGNIRYGQQAVISSNINGQIFETAVTAYSTKNIVPDSIWNYSMNQEVIFRLDNDEEATNVYSLLSSVKIKDIEISDVVLLDSSFIYSEVIDSAVTGETEYTFFVYVKTGDYISKRYIEPASYVMMGESVTWVKTGLSAGEVCVAI